MSFLTEYFDEYRQHPIRKTRMCCPEERWANVTGKWLDPKIGAQDKEWTDEEINHFIKETMRSVRGQSTYYNDYCAHMPSELKTRKFKPRVKKLPPCSSLLAEKDEVSTDAIADLPKLAIKDTELMKLAQDLYEKDLEQPTLKPITTLIRS